MQTLACILISSCRQVQVQQELGDKDAEKLKISRRKAAMADQNLPDDWERPCKAMPLRYDCSSNLVLHKIVLHCIRTDAFWAAGWRL